MSSHIDERHLWQHVLLEIESALHIAIQMECATLTNHSHETVDTVVRVARLTSENLALHNRVMSRVPEDTHSVDSHSSFGWGQPDGRSMYPETISSKPAEPIPTIRVGPIFGPPCTECMILPAVRPSRDPNRIPRLRCYRCIQRSVNELQALYFMDMFHQQAALSPPNVALRIVEYMLGTGLEKYCHCGRCNLDWFLHGWECWPAQR